MTLTKTQATELIDGLTNKTLSFGCRINHKAKGELVFISEKYCQKPEHDSEYGCNDSDYCNNFACLEVSSNRVIYGNCWTSYEVIGHPTLIGQIAKRIAWKYNDEEFGTDFLTQYDFIHSGVPKLFELWGACEKRDEELSLQEIYKMIEWEGEVVKPSLATELFEFLYSLNLVK